MKKVLFFFALLLSITFGYSQVGINTTTPDAQLDIKSSNQATPANNDGILIPKIDAFPLTNPTTAQNSMMVYLTTTSSGKQPGFYYWDNATTSWKGFGSDFGWNLTGNLGTTPGTNFIGTTDDKPLMFKINNNQAGVLGASESYSVFFGRDAGAVNLGFWNVGIGSYALNLNTWGSSNVAIGQLALNKNTTGYSNFALGTVAMNNNTIGNNNIAIGENALDKNVSGSYAIAIGSYAMRYSNETSTAFDNKNIAIGYQSLMGSTTPANNTGNSNTALGYQSLNVNTSGSGNSAIGDRALSANTTGAYNTAFGYLSLVGNVSGVQNNAHGSEVLLGNSTGSYNSGFGYRALNSNNGNNNSAFGNGTLLHNTMASNNVSVGYRALSEQNFYNGGVTYDTDNVAIGVDALRYNNPTSIANGKQNVAFGNYSLNSNTTGYNNTALGNRALFNNTTGYNNTAVGYNVYATSSTALNNYTGLGYNVGGATSASNMVEIGNTSVTSIRGQVNFTTYSDRRIKKNIEENVLGLSFITQLRPVTYNLDIHKQNEIIYKDKPESKEDWESKYEIENIKQTGFIAQEVVQTAKLLNYDFSGVDIPKDSNGLYGLRYAEFVVPLVKAVQEQQEIIENQNYKIQSLEERLKVLEEKLKE